MNFRPRSLVSNSFGSVVASGVVIVATLLLPALLVRSLSPVDYRNYLIVLAFLPILLMLPQSTRTIAASQLALAATDHRLSAAVQAFARFTATVIIAQGILGFVGIEVYTNLEEGSSDVPRILKAGLGGMLVYSVGLLVVGLVVAPAAAQRDFRPDNLGKALPILMQIAGVMAVAIVRPPNALLWVFGVYAASSWLIAITLFAVSPMSLEALVSPQPRSSRSIQRKFLHGLGGVLWWNITAFFSTSIAVMVVALDHPLELAEFSNATALLAVLSGGLIAISGPIVVHATTMSGDFAARRRFFLRVNGFFQVYILMAAVAVVLTPEAVYATWLNAELAPGVKQFSLLLLPAMALRLLTMAFTLFIMSAGRQHKLWLSPLMESVIASVGCFFASRWIGIEAIPLVLFLSAAARLLLTVTYDCAVNRAELQIGGTDVVFPIFKL